MTQFSHAIACLRNNPLKFPISARSTPPRDKAVIPYNSWMHFAMPHVWGKVKPWQWAKSLLSNRSTLDRGKTRMGLILDNVNRDLTIRGLTSPAVWLTNYDNNFSSLFATWSGEAIRTRYIFTVAWHDCHPLGLQRKGVRFFFLLGILCKSLSYGNRSSYFAEGREISPKLTSYGSVLVLGPLIAGPTIKSFSKSLKVIISPCIIIIDQISSFSAWRVYHNGESMDRILAWDQLDWVKQDASEILWSANCWLSSLIQQQPFTKLVKNSAYYRWVKDFCPGLHDCPPALLYLSPLISSHSLSQTIPTNLIQLILSK